MTSVNFLSDLAGIDFPARYYGLLESYDTESYFSLTFSYHHSCKNVKHDSLLWLHRLCSDNSEFTSKICKLLDFFHTYLYPEPIFKEALMKEFPSNSCSKTCYTCIWEPSNDLLTNQPTKQPINHPINQLTIIIISYAVLIKFLLLSHYVCHNLFLLSYVWTCLFV